MAFYEELFAPIQAYLRFLLYGLDTKDEGTDIGGDVYKQTHMEEMIIALGMLLCKWHGFHYAVSSLMIVHCASEKSYLAKSKVSDMQPHSGSSPFSNSFSGSSFINWMVANRWANSVKHASIIGQRALAAGYIRSTDNSPIFIASDPEHKEGSSGRDDLEFGLGNQNTIRPTQKVAASATATLKEPMYVITSNASRFHTAGMQVCTKVQTLKELLKSTSNSTDVLALCM